MNRFNLTFVSTVCIIGLVHGGDSSSSAEASLAFAKAKMSRHLKYVDGIQQSKKTGKPVLIVINLDCGSLCSQIRDSVLVVKEKELFGSSQPRVILAMPIGNDIMRIAEWSSIPKKEQVINELNKHSPRGMLDLFDLTTSLAISQFPFSDPSCPDGRCPVPELKRMPTADGPVYAYPESAPIMIDAPRRPVLFPRLFAIRQKLRLGFGLRRVRYVVVSSQIEPSENVASSISSRGNGRIIQQILMRRGVPLDKIAMLQKKYSDDSPVWWLLLRALIEYGLPKLLDLIEELLK